MKISSLPIPSEHVEQVKLVNWLRFKSYWFCAIPNGARTSLRQAVKLKAEGLVSGAPDILIFDSPVNTDFKGIALEMKRQKGGVQSKDQKIWEVELGKRGWKYILAKGYDDAVSKLEKLGY